MTIPEFKEGDYVEMVFMPDDPCPITVGTRGVVKGVTDTGRIWPNTTQYQIVWENGRTLMTLCPPDVLKLVGGRGVSEQKARHSLLETCLNTLSGFLISLSASFLIFPALGIQVTAVQNFQQVTIFTAISITRSYIWRRVFNHLQTTGRLG